MAADGRVIGAAFLVATALATMPVAAETAPMSAIDWLSQSLDGKPAAQPVAIKPKARPKEILNEPPVASSAAIEPVAISSLDAPSADAIGLLPVARTGLPRDLWGTTPEGDLARALRAVPRDALPALQQLRMELLLAELSPPLLRDPENRDALFLARIDTLLDLGALEPAFTMLGEAQLTQPEVFRRYFDVALLLGEEDRACQALEKAKGLTPALPTRIFCQARSEDWDAAVISLSSARALGTLDPENELLLAQFLDPALADEEGPLDPPARISPLNFRMMEAVGQPLPTNDLPLAFAQADLRANTGWKARLEAGERLARAGSLDPNQMLGLYTENDTGPSGGLWDRVRAMQALDHAMQAKDGAAITEALPAAWTALQEAELEALIGALWGKELAEMAQAGTLTGDAAALAYRAGLLSDAYETVAQAHQGTDTDQRLWAGIARGATGDLAALDQLGLALKAVFDTPVSATPEAYQTLLPDQLGLAVLQAIDDITEGAKGDYGRLGDGLKLLRFVGLEDEARRTALQLLLLERRG